MKDYANKDWLKDYEPSELEILFHIAVASAAVFIPIALWWVL